MKNIAQSQKLAISIILVIVIIAEFVFAGIYLYKKNTQDVVAPMPQSANQASAPTSLKVPVQPISKDYNQIIKDLEAKIGNKTITAADYVELAVAYQNLGKIDKAEIDYNQALTIDPNNARAYNNMGNIYRDRGDFVKAEQYYKSALSLDSKNSKTYINLAFLYNNLVNDKQKAIAVVNQGLAAIPDSQELKDILGEYSK